jgi:drug/metabolite transporter (DMT)-like permease
MSNTRTTRGEQDLSVGRSKIRDKAILLSIGSGILASMASVTAKLALDTPDVSLTVRIVLFGVMIGVNVFMWTSYSKALDSSSSAVVASVINTLSNFVTTGIMGFLLFQEKHVFSFLWSSGMILVILGLCLILHDDTKREDNKGGDVHFDTSCTVSKNLKKQS